MNTEIIKLVLNSLNFNKESLETIMEMMDYFSDESQENILLMMAGRYEMPEIPEEINVRLDYEQTTGKFLKFNKITQEVTYSYHKKFTKVFCTPESKRLVESLLVESRYASEIRKEYPEVSTVISDYRSNSCSCEVHCKLKTPIEQELSINLKSLLRQMGEKGFVRQS